MEEREGKRALKRWEEEVMPDASSFKRSSDSYEDSGSNSFHGVGHPPEPIDTDLMRPVYVPIGQDKGNGKCLVKNVGPFLEDVPYKKPSSSLLSPAESIIEESNDLARIPYHIRSPYEGSRRKL
nr:serine/threonine-protein kinase D6PKL1 [Ipomoea batatas]